MNGLMDSGSVSRTRQVTCNLKLNAEVTADEAIRTAWSIDTESQDRETQHTLQKILMRSNCEGAGRSVLQNIINS